MLKSKKGFSLVELIVVIAIMAVLVGVLAPALMGQVEKSRKQKDESAVAELVHSVEIAIADENVYDEIVKIALAEGNTDKKATLTFTISADAVGGKRGLTIDSCASDSATLTNMKASLAEQLNDFALTSKAYGAETSYDVIVDMSGSAVKVSGAWGSAD